MKQAVNFTRSILMVTSITLTLLSIPLIAMQFTDEVNWSGGDFLVMGLLIFTTGLSFAAIIRHSKGILQRLAVIAAVGSTFLMIWSNLAVGLIGGGGHWGNFMYLAVLVIVVVGSILSNYSAKGMERTMFAASLTITLIAVIALIAGMQHYPESSVQQIIGVNAFFATLYAIAGLLFRFAAVNRLASKVKA